MTNEKVDRVFREIITHWAPQWPPARLDGGVPETFEAAMCHCVALAMAGLDLPPEKLEKKFRWLGFIQGVLWTTGQETLEELKQMNMPDEEKP